MGVIQRAHIFQSAFSQHKVTKTDGGEGDEGKISAINHIPIQFPYAEKSCTNHYIGRKYQKYHCDRNIYN